MTTIEKKDAPPALEALASECFESGQILRRQLRLTGAQAELFRMCYPAEVRPMGGEWYEITFQGAFSYGN